MPFRAVIYNKDRTISLIYPDTKKGSWFDFRKRSYLIDLEAVCQVVKMGNKIKSVVEALYVEGYPLPMRSKLDLEKVTTENFQAKRDSAQHKPAVSLLDKLRGK